MTEHSILAPSSAARRMLCPGSRALEAIYPQEESEHTRQGTAAHWVAQQLFEGCVLDKTAPNGEIITHEMFEAAQEYVIDVNTVLNTVLLARSQLHTEEKISIARIHPECFGTPDAWAFIDNQLYIWDFKYGHKFVEVFENWQLIAYASGILGILGINGNSGQFIEVVFKIVQPRSYHKDGPIREWRINASSLRPYFNQLEASEHESMKSDALLKTNPECNFCNARHACPALQQASAIAIDLSTSNTPWDLTSLQTGNELRYIKRAIKLLEARESGLEAQALSMLKIGAPVPHFSIEATMGRERWVKPAEEIITMGELMGYPLAKPAACITPKQAIKLGVDADIVRQFSETPRGAMKLVEVKPSDVKKLLTSPPTDGNV